MTNQIKTKRDTPRNKAGFEFCMSFEAIRKLKKLFFISTKQSNDQRVSWNGVEFHRFGDANLSF